MQVKPTQCSGGPVTEFESSVGLHCAAYLERYTLMIKKVCVSIIYLAIIAACSFSFLIYVKNRLDKKAQTETQKIVEILTPLIDKTGNLPNELNEILERNNLQKEVHVWPFSTEIRIREFEGVTTVEYYGFPLGPFYGFNFLIREWEIYE